MTYILLAMVIVIYIVESILGGSFIEPDISILLILGQYNRLVFMGWWWQLFTSMFVHASFEHILFNAFFLWMLGVQYERIFGGDSLLYTYVVSGLAGNLLTLFLLPRSTISVGASGGIFGIFGAILMYNARLTGKIGYYLLYGFIIFLFNSLYIKINILAHLGGLVTGFIIGDYYGKKAASYLSGGRVLIYS